MTSRGRASRPDGHEGRANREDEIVLVVEDDTTLELNREAAATLARMVRAVLGRPNRGTNRSA